MKENMKYMILSVDDEKETHCASIFWMLLTPDSGGRNCLTIIIVYHALLAKNMSSIL